MSHYYGGVEGGSSEATRTGHRKTGLKTRAQTYRSQVKVAYDYAKDDDGTERDFITVSANDLNGKMTVLFHGSEDELLRRLK